MASDLRAKQIEETLDEEIDAMLDDFEDDDEMAELREKRMAELQSLYKSLENKRDNEHGIYAEVTEEDFLPLVTSSNYVVAHFYHKDFNRCEIADKHLSLLAERHFDTKFIRVNVETAPFLVTKLAIRVLPTLVFFVDGVAVDRIVGFEELGNTDKFTTKTLERRIQLSGAIPRKDEVTSVLSAGALRLE